MEITENKALFQTIFDSASNGIAVLQSALDEKGDVADFTILLLNTYILRWLGDVAYKGKRYSDVFPAVRESGILLKFIEVAKTGVTANFEHYFTGERIKHWFHFTAVRQDDLLVVTIEDITEQKQAEINLKNALDNAEKQRRLSDSITNNTPDLVYVFDLNYRFTYVNKALLTMWGKTAEDAIGRGLRENGYEEWHASMHEREIDEIIAAKKSVRGTVSFPHAELGNRIYDYILVPVFNEAGEVEAIAGTTRDITEIKRSEDQLVQSEARIRGMIDQTPTPTLVLMGDDLVIEQINQSMLKMIGHTEEVVGIPLLTVMPELTGSYIWNEVLRVYEQGVPFDQWEVLVTHKRTGVMKDYYYNIAYRPLKENGRIIGMIQVAIDVTEQVTARKRLEESESRFRFLADESPMFVFIIEPDPLAPVSYWNKTYLNYTGQTFKEAQGRAWDGIIHPDDINIVMDHYVPAFADQKPYFIPFVRTKRYDGVYRWFAFKGNPRYSADGSFNGYVGVGFDVHDQKITEEKLELLVEERTKELLRSNEDLQQFAHVASHDLKEPVRKIKTFAGRLEHHLEGRLDDASARFIERINVATDRMFTMIDGVLAYSTTNAGPQKTELVSLNEVIKNIEGDLEIALQRTGGTIHYCNLPTVEGASVLLYQLFYNLINNSIKFARPGIPPSISITSKVEEDGQAEITLTDNGIGFEPHHAERIFETFTRLNPKDEYEGTGLGLSLCKKIVERHGGTIIATGGIHAGAKFIITLPLKQYETGV